jgi:transposase
MGIKQQRKELEKRRKRGMRLLAAGVWLAEVARHVGVARQSMLRWTKLKEQGSVQVLMRPERLGRPPKLNDVWRTELIRAHKGGALAAAFASELWTLPLIATLIKERFGVDPSHPSVGRVLKQLGWNVQRPAKRARERDELAIRTWKEKRWPTLKKSLRGKAA